MSKIVNLDRVSLKNCNGINENAIQKFIYENPSVLGLGDLSPVQREKVQPAGGRLDILLEDDGGSRYEVEIQLGATDPSHIIRTIEYWDSERKHHPQYDHCAVIVAEEITGRFMNVISLFNGAIPLIALQLSAYKQGEDFSLAFTKVLETYANEDDEQLEITDRKYWESKSTPKMLKQVDLIFENLQDTISGYELKYNKFYIGMAKEGVSKNFLMFRPKKNYMYLVFRGNDDSDLIQRAEDEGLDINYKARFKEAYLRVKDYDDYMKHKQFIDKCIISSMNYFNITE